jgi:hypothetical protein
VPSSHAAKNVSASLTIPYPGIPMDLATMRGRPVSRTAPARPHFKLHLSPKVMQRINAIALDQNRRPHDLLREGVSLLLKKYTPRAG